MTRLNCIYLYRVVWNDIITIIAIISITVTATFTVWAIYSMSEKICMPNSVYGAYFSRSCGDDDILSGLNYFFLWLLNKNFLLSPLSTYDFTLSSKQN